LSAREVPAERVRAMTAEDLARVLAWRNHPNVRDFMLSQRDIGAEEHRQWFERCMETGSKRLLIFEAGGEAMGFVSFNAPDPGGITEWGFYSRPDAPKGTGQKLGAVAIRHAFEELDVHKIFGRTLGNNPRSIRCHQRLGFKQEGVLRDQHFGTGRYHDIVCFGLLRAEWQS
jgi:UDP-4-amino-4,6-dideoxy-N-acetyl-beta-L-altrosamine N-acetyltransferase